MTNLRDYDRDALLIEKVRDLERQLAAAQAVIERLCAEIPKYELAIEKQSQRCEALKGELLAERADLADAHESLDIVFTKGNADGHARKRARFRKAILQVILAAAPKPGDE